MPNCIEPAITGTALLGAGTRFVSRSGATQGANGFATVMDNRLSVPPANIPAEKSLSPTASLTVLHGVKIPNTKSAPQGAAIAGLNLLSSFALLPAPPTPTLPSVSDVNSASTELSTSAAELPGNSSEAQLSHLLPDSNAATQMQIPSEAPGVLPGSDHADSVDQPLPTSLPTFEQDQLQNLDDPAIPGQASAPTDVVAAANAALPVSQAEVPGDDPNPVMPFATAQSSISSSPSAGSPDSNPSQPLTLGQLSFPSALADLQSAPSASAAAAKISSPQPLPQLEPSKTKATNVSKFQVLAMQTDATDPSMRAVGVDLNQAVQMHVAGSLADSTTVVRQGTTLGNRTIAPSKEQNSSGLNVSAFSVQPAAGARYTPNAVTKPNQNVDTGNSSVTPTVQNSSGDRRPATGSPDPSTQGQASADAPAIVVTASAAQPATLVVPAPPTSTADMAGTAPNAQTPNGNTAKAPSEVPTAVPNAIDASVQSPSPVHLAQIVDRAVQSEMRIGLATSAFGSVEVRTIVHANDVGIVIGSEKGDLRSLIAPELPGIASNLQQQDLRLNQVNFHQGGALSGNLPGDSQGRNSGTPSRTWSRPDGLGVGGREPEPALAAWEPVMAAGLNILA